MAATGIPQLRAVADYQFGAGAGAALFPVDEEGATEIRRSTSGRPQQVLAGAGRIVSYNVDGRFTLGLEGGRRLTNVFPAPRCRVNVGAESVPFVCDGKNAFCKFVRRVDPAIRSGDEVLVTYDAGDEEDTGTGNDTDETVTSDETAETDGTTRDEPHGKADVEPGTLLAVGRAELAADTMADFETGVAVKVRDAIGATE